MEEDNLKIVDLINTAYLKEYIKLSALEWGKSRSNEEMNQYIDEKSKRIKIEDKVIAAIGLIKNDILVGFISLFKYDGEEHQELTPWYATMYVKKEYRGMGYSKTLNDALLDKARELNYKKIYLKSNLENYYEKFGAHYLETLNNGEKLFEIIL